MTHHSFLLILLVMALGSPTVIYAMSKGGAQDEVYSMTLIQVSQTDDDSYHIDDSSYGHRIPPCPIRCEISENGVIIFGVNTSDIILFEIYSMDGVCVDTFVNEGDFVSTFLELNGEYEVRFITIDYIYQGCALLM